MGRPNIGKLIFDKRNDLNLTQSELAEMLHVSSQAVSKWERDLSFPDITILNELADVLEIDVADFFKNSENTTSVIPEVLNYAGDTISKLRHRLMITVVSVCIVLLCIFGYLFINYINRKDLAITPAHFSACMLVVKHEDDVTELLLAVFQHDVVLWENGVDTDTKFSEIAGDIVNQYNDFYFVEFYIGSSGKDIRGYFPDYPQISEDKRIIYPATPTINEYQSYSYVGESYFESAEYLKDTDLSVCEVKNGFHILTAYSRYYDLSSYKDVEIIAEFYQKEIPLYLYQTKIAVDPELPKGYQWLEEIVATRNRLYAVTNNVVIIDLREQ